VGVRADQLGGALEVDVTQGPGLGGGLLGVVGGGGGVEGGRVGVGAGLVVCEYYTRPTGGRGWGGDCNALDTQDPRPNNPTSTCPPSLTSTP